MEPRYWSLVLLLLWFGAMIVVLRWAFRRRLARAAAGERVGCLGSEALVILVAGVLLTVALAAATIFVTSRG